MQVAAIAPKGLARMLRRLARVIRNSASWALWALASLRQMFINSPYQFSMTACAPKESDVSLTSKDAIGAACRSFLTIELGIEISSVPTFSR